MTTGRTDLLSEPSLPSRETIAGWKVECAKIEKAISRLNAKFAAYQDMIRAAEVLLPDEDESQPQALAPVVDVAAVEGSSELPVTRKPRGRPPGPVKRRHDPGTWTGTIEKIVIQAGRGITHDEAREEIAKTHLGKKLEKSDKSFYGGIGKLVGRNCIIRHKGRLYSPGSYRAFVADVRAGRAVDDEAPRGGHHSPFGDAIKAFLGDREFGATSSEIIAELRTTPEFLDTIERHKTHTYNVLSRLVDQGELVKGGGKFFRAPNRMNGAPP